VDAAVGQLITQQNANGTWVSCSYDDGGRLTQLVNLKSDNTTLSSFAYALDNIGDRVGVTEANGDIVTYSYDNAYQLTREQRSGANTYDITYSYDPVGNRLSKIERGVTTTYTYDAANQIETETTPSQITTFTFDANGNTQVENAGGQLTTYSWDIENMCVGIALPSGTLNTFAYDADLKRRQAEDSAGLAKFINDLENVLLETDSGGTTLVMYTLEPMAYGNLISQRRSGATAWHLYDALGSTDRLSDANQSDLATYLNSAFGVPVAATGSHPNRLRWLGRLGYRWEPDPGEYDVRKRRFSPAQGNWLSADSILRDLDAIERVVSEMLSAYNYAGNNPPTYADPSGMIRQELGTIEVPIPDLLFLVSVVFEAEGTFDRYECCNDAVLKAALLIKIGFQLTSIKKLPKMIGTEIRLSVRIILMILAFIRAQIKALKDKWWAVLIRLAFSNHRVAVCPLRGFEEDMWARLYICKGLPVIGGIPWAGSEGETRGIDRPGKARLLWICWPGFELTGNYEFSYTW